MRLMIDRELAGRLGVVRPIVYRLAMSEIYVPYGIDDPNWVWRSAFDIGEYNLGQFAVTQEKNVDVPEKLLMWPWPSRVTPIELITPLAVLPLPPMSRVFAWLSWKVNPP